MKTSSLSLKRICGSALLVVIILVAIMALLTTSILSYSLTERRINERERQVLAARNMAENLVNYGAAQISTKLYRLRSSSPIQYSGANPIYLPPASSVLSTEYGAGVVEVHAGLTSSTALTYVDPLLSANASNPYRGLSVITSKVPVIGKATLSHPVLGPYTAYTLQELSAAQIPLYQFAIFYNMPLELGPGADMVIEGPVHTNGLLAARNQFGRDNTLQFKDRVTAVCGFYANNTKLGAIYRNMGMADMVADPGGTGPLLFQNPTGTATDVRSGSGFYSDHTMSTNATGPETTATIAAFRSYATNNFAGNLRTSAHAVPVIVPPGVLDATAGRHNAARVTVEPALVSDSPGVVQAKFSRFAGLYIIVNPTPADRNGIKPDGSTVLMKSYSYRCWLNTTTMTGTTTTNALTEIVLPGQPTYGERSAIVNALPNRFTNLTAIGSNQVLRIPGLIGEAGYSPQPHYATVTPNASVTPNFGVTSATDRWPLTTAYETGTRTLTDFKEAYFFDLRRADGSNGYGTPATHRNVVAFAPRPISKIDFDMIRFRLAVERTLYSSTSSTRIYNPDVLNAGNWAQNVLNSSATPATVALGPRTGLGTLAFPYVYTVFPVDGAGRTVSDPFKIYKATGVGVAPVPLTQGGFTDPWYDGIAIYIHSVGAEDRSTDAGVRTRIDSGVRILNGRGPVASLSATGRTGCSIATNDAAYIFGHLNADGLIGTTSSTQPDLTSEYLCNIMADALTVLSQPVYDTSYVQTAGWSDSLSANAVWSSPWSSSWMSIDPSARNYCDGITNNRYAGRMPTEGSYTSAPTQYGTASYAGAPARQIKFPGADTEISSCLLQGIVRTTSALYPRRRENPVTPAHPDGTGDWLTYETLGYQSSGGVHNFPRMSEDWTIGMARLAIRGSMVAMFESEVACEPWLATRVYSAPTRLWGLHTNLKAENSGNGKHDVPLEPMMIEVSRWRYTALTPAEYANQALAIAALPTP
jgi:hypothetical protein